MRWRRQRWPEREPRPEARTLTDEERTKLLATMTREVAASPVLTGLGLQVRSQRGRFYLERRLGEGTRPASKRGAGSRRWPARMTCCWSRNATREAGPRSTGDRPETDQDHCRRHQGDVPRPGALDKALRRAGKGLERLPVQREGTTFVDAESGEGCSAQEALFHYFRLPLHVLVEPSEWYSYHRKPTIAEGSEDRTRVLVRFGAMSSSGESFGGTCLYTLRDGRWGAYPIRPSESRDIASAEAWLVKRKWRAWDR